MKKLLPIILIVLGLGGGIGAGVMLKPAPEPEPEAEAKADKTMAKCDPSVEDCPGVEPEYAMIAEIDIEPIDPEAVWEYVKLPRQFVVPVISKSRVYALVVMTISVEVAEGTTQSVLTRQPRIRDAFLQVMFKHANSGGFDGAFTTGKAMDDLRGSLREVARLIIGEDVNSVLIEEIVKQQM